MQIAAAGDRALLADLGDVSAAELHAAASRARTLPGVVTCIAGHSSLYVIFADAPDAATLAKALSSRVDAPELFAQPHRVPLCFDGENLGEFLALHRLTRDEFLARVTSLTLTARYLGFRAGFAYLDGWPAEWAMPRRATSRPVAAGSFAIAGNVAGIYPIDTPGGWNILGRTSTIPRLAAGDTLTFFVECGENATAVTSAPRPAVPDAIELTNAPLAVMVDRTDWTRIPPGGPFDPLLAALANRAVDREPDAALLECALVVPKLRARRACVVAFASPDGAVRVHELRAGEELAIGRIAGGLRGYVAIGDRVGVVANIERRDRNVIRIAPGPHDAGLRDVECEVTPQLDRVGIRLRPLQSLRIEAPADLRSVGMQCGTVQLHPDGSLVAMGPEHPVTGGYLQPVTVLAEERWKLAQLVPGERVRLLYEPNA